MCISIFVFPCIFLIAKYHYYDHFHVAKLHDVSAHLSVKVSEILKDLNGLNICLKVV